MAKKPKKQPKQNQQPQRQQKTPKKQAKEMGRKEQIRKAYTGARKQNKQQTKDQDLINPEKAVKRIRSTLTAAEKQLQTTEDGAKYWVNKPDWQNALVTKPNGIKTIMSVVEGCINQAAAGGYTDRKDEFKAGFYAMTSLAKKIHKNKDEMGIETWEDASLIMDIIAYNLKMTLTKARGGRAMKHGETIRDVREFIDEGDETSKRSSRSSSWMPF